MALEKYKKMRSFDKTPEPADGVHHATGALHFVVQKHDASHLHYDFRLEIDGVLKSWAIPKGPSLNPADKRLAMMTEDHPYSYKDFEGVIPQGQYGGGDVIVWDTGVFASSETADLDEGHKKLRQGLHKGELSFVLFGEKLKGGYTLIKLGANNKYGKRGGDNAWLLVKQKDEYASTEDVTERKESVLTGVLLPRDGGTGVATVYGSKKQAKKPQAKPAAQKLVKKTARPKKGSDPMPHDVRPMLATLVDQPFDREGWIFEMKWDGYRAIAEVEDGKVELYSRKGNSFASTYKPIVEALKSVQHDLVLDGEVIALKDGRPDFHTLQQYKESPAPLQYAIFDLLWVDGEDLRNLPLVERKARLKKVIPEHPQLLVSEHIETKGKAFFKKMQQAHIEGMLAKDGQSRYVDGARSKSWLKVKTSMEQEAIIVGYTEPRGSRKSLGALVLAVHIDGKLAYIGHSGGGFTGKELTELCKTLSKIKTEKSPLTEKVPINSPITWVKPKYVCQVRFSEWTPDGRMRHPIYAGLREDKKPAEVIKETPDQAKKLLKAEKNNKVSPRSEKKLQDSAKSQSARGKGQAPATPDTGLELSNLDKVYFPESGITKGDLIDYYRRMANTILPYLKYRPENLNRHPNGWEGKSFYQKDTKNDPPDFVRTVNIWSDSNNAELRYMVCDNVETLLYMANLGCIEINPWNSRVDSLHNPDYMIFDIDPGDHNTFEQVIRVAQEFHRVLTLACEEHYPKTSGKTGIHIYVPLKARYDYDQIRDFSQLVAQLVHRALPDITSMERSPAKRKDKIYLDYLQNRFGQTIAAPYSVRPAAGAPVSTPLEWNEVKKGLDPAKFTIKNIEKRLEKKGDLWKPVLGKGVDLAASITCLQKEVGKD